MRLLVVLVALVLTACGGDDEILPPDAQVQPDAPESSDAATTDVIVEDAGLPADAPPCVLHGGLVRENIPGMPYPALPALVDVTITALVDGVEVAQTASIADGSYSICVPPDTSVALVFQKAGFNDQAFLRVTTVDSLYMDVRMFSHADLQSFWDGVGATYPSTDSGFVTLVTFDSTLVTTVAGVSTSVSPASGTGPFYFDETYTYDPALTETGPAGLVVFANVQPGQVDVLLDHATLTCRHERGGFVSPTPNALRIPVLAGVETSINVKCE